MTTATDRATRARRDRPPSAWVGAILLLTLALGSSSPGWAAPILPAAERAWPARGASAGTHSGDALATGIDLAFLQHAQLSAVTGGSGYFADSGQRLGSRSSRDVALGDLDKDGDLDAFVANGSGPNEAWCNSGQGQFTLCWTESAAAKDSRGVALGDLDRDGDLDAFVANFGTANTVWFNNGSASFTYALGLGTDHSTSAAVGDVDNDNDLDVVVGNQFQESRIYLNDGNGSSFTASAYTLGKATDPTQDVALGDVDNDYDLDIVLANQGTPNQVYRNQGGGHFTAAPQDLLGSPTKAVAFGDLNGDGYLDLFFAIEAQADHVFLYNTGSGLYDGAPAQAIGGDGQSQDGAVGDLNADGKLDLFVTIGSNGPDRVYFRGTTSFADTGQSLGNSAGDGVALGDLDGDGDLDAFVANTNGQANTVWLNRNKANLAVGKTVHPPLVRPGQAVTYVLAFTNWGPDTAHDVVIVDDVPDTLTGVTYSSTRPVTPTGVTPYTWQVGSLGPLAGGLITVTGTVDPTASGEFAMTNEASIASSSAYDDDPGNNTSSAANLVDAEAPPVPVLQSPGHTAQISDTTPILVWSASPTAVGYMLDCNGSVQDVGGTTIYPVGPLGDNTYTWRVAAYDLAGNLSAYAPTWSFTVDTIPPAPPALQSPAHGATISDTTPALTWAASAEAVGYMVRWDGYEADAGNTLSHTLPELADGAHSWQVAAYDAARNLSTYASRTFTLDATPPPVPVLQSPADGLVATIPAVTLSWGVSGDAVGYMVQWNGVASNVGNTTQQARSSLADGVYTWSVAAYDPIGNLSAYATARSLRVDTTPPEVAGVRPANGAKVASLGGPITTQFSEPVQTASFQYQVSPSLANVSLDWSADRRTVSIRHAEFSRGTLYTVTVLAAVDDAGWALSGIYQWSFTTATYELFMPAVLRGN